MKNSITYADAGVDIDAGNELVDRIKPAAASTTRPGVVSGLGEFGGLFDLKEAGFQDPVLVAATDGVGTKLRIAIDTGQVDTVGIDLVAMCVNDLICQGAEPLFFLDYFATGKLSVDHGAMVVEGIAEGCRQANCALIGGETAEMPGMYSDGDFDLAGFAIGAMERGSALPTGIVPGDVVLGLASNGIHSNGYSLVRRIVADNGLGWDASAPFADVSLGEAMLEPTRIYVRSLMPLIRQGLVRGFAHITGGGLTENIPRALPQDVSLSVNLDAWDLPPVFRWLISQSGLEQAEALKTFNCGIGMVVIAKGDFYQDAERLLKDAGETVHHLGVIGVPGEDGPGLGFTGALM